MEVMAVVWLISGILSLITGANLVMVLLRYLLTLTDTSEVITSVLIFLFCVSVFGFTIGVFDPFIAKITN